MELFLGWWAAALLINNFSSKKTKNNSDIMTFVPFQSEPMPETLVVDCSHTNAKQLTHHLKGPNQKKMIDLTLRGDSSTDAVLNSIIRKSTFTEGLKHVSSNHFDVDSFTASWCFIYPDLAQTHEQIIREISRIGDFREVRLDHPYQHIALQVTCWLNSEERRLFYRPFESKISAANGELDGVAKFEYFLPIFADVLANPEKYRSEWSEEYERVVKEYATVNASPTHIEKSSGLILVDLIEPTHYYSLFSISRGLDAILALYAGNKYELEVKYTSMIDLGSRPTLPRVDLTPLAEYLNKLENAMNSELVCQAVTEKENKITELQVVDGLEEREKRSVKATNAEDKGLEETFKWHCDRITDSGPILRLNSNINKLSKAARYGHPYERPIFSSLIGPTQMKKIVISFFSHAYTLNGCAIRPKRDHEWAELHDFNRNIDWSTWNPAL